MTERIFGLGLRGLPEPGQPRFTSTYLDEQPSARVGVAVDAELRGEGADNVLVAGAALPGAIAGDNVTVNVSGSGAPAEATA